jgi:hypothetical protein
VIKKQKIATRHKQNENEKRNCRLGVNIRFNITMQCYDLSIRFEHVR